MPYLPLQHPQMSKPTEGTPGGAGGSVAPRARRHRADIRLEARRADAVAEGRTMKFVAPRPFADPEIAARKVVEIANATGSGRPHQTDSLHRSKHRPLFDHLVRGRQLVPVSGDDKRSVPDARAGT